MSDRRPMISHLSDISIIEETEQYVLVDKPNNINSTEIIEKLSRKLLLNIGQTGLVYTLPPDIGGLLIISKNKKSLAFLRNSYGSYQFQLIFDIFSIGGVSPKNSPIVCGLPIAKHRTKNLYLISSTTGEKALTTFTFVKKLGRFEHWRANCTYLRGDQIPLHAHEVGIDILGDEKYANCPIPSFKELKRNFKNNRKENNEYPYFGPAIHLTALQFPDGHIVQINLPKKLSVFMKLLSLS